MSYKFEGKNILVTGSGRGIGRGIAIALVKSGANVYALSKTKANLDSLLKEEPNIQPIHQDLSDWDATRNVVDNIAVLDGLVNNAAVVPAMTDAVDTPKEDIDQILDINLKGVINLMQVVGKKMIKAEKGGSIVNMSSIVEQRAFKGLMPYCVSKAGLNMATKMFALELGMHKIRVNTISPGTVRTEVVDQYGPEALKHAASLMPVGRVCEVQEIVDSVMFLLSDKSLMITGTDLVIDGGHSCYVPV